MRADRQSQQEAVGWSFSGPELSGIKSNSGWGCGGDSGQTRLSPHPLACRLGSEAGAPSVGLLAELLDRLFLKDSLFFISW